MKGLSPKQREIFNFIQVFIDQNHYSPSYREIMKHFSFSSPGSVYKHIRTLKRKGVLEAEKQSSRSLIPIETASSIRNKSEIELPIIGSVVAGCTIEMFMQPQTLAVPAFLIHNSEKTYILRVHGNSLNEEAIKDGDLLLVEARQEAQAGETILALVNQHTIMIKRYYPEGQYIRLEGDHHQPMILRQESIFIQGILVGIIRIY